MLKLRKKNDKNRLRYKAGPTIIASDLSKTIYYDLCPVSQKVNTIGYTALQRQCHTLLEYFKLDDHNV